MSISPAALNARKVTFPGPARSACPDVRIDIGTACQSVVRAAAPADETTRRRFISSGSPWTHLRQPGHGIGHEVNDQLGERFVEVVVREGQLLGGPGPHVDPRDAFAQRRDERGGRIDRRDGVDAESLHQQRGQCARSATDVEDPHPPVIRHPHESTAGGSNRPMNRTGVPGR